MTLSRNAKLRQVAVFSMHGHSEVTWLDGIMIEILDALLSEDIFVHQEATCEVLRLGQDVVGSVCDDVYFTALFTNTITTQHVHGRCLYCYDNVTQRGAALAG